MLQVNGHLELTVGFTKLPDGFVCLA